MTAEVFMDQLLAQGTSIFDNASPVESANQIDLGSFIIIPLVWLTGIVAFVALISLLIWIYRFSKRQKEIFDFVFLNVIMPRGNEIKIEAAEQMFASFYSLFRDSITSVVHGQPHLSIELVSQNGEVRFYIVCPKDQKDIIIKHVHSSYPEADIRQVPPYNLFKGGGYVSVAELKLKTSNYFPIKRYKELENVDPLNNLTNALGDVNENETAAVQLLISPANASWQAQALKLTEHQSNPQAPVEEAKDENPNTQIANLVVKTAKTDPDTAKKIQEKISKIGFNCAVRVLVNASSQAQADSYLNSLVGTFSQFTDPLANGFKKKNFPWNLSKRTLVRYFIYRIFPLVFGKFVLTSEELASIFHFPNKNVTSPKVFWLDSRRASAPLTLPDSGLYLGKSIFRGEEKKVFMLPDDRRRHTYIIGQTGVGKSELLKFMAIQDIKNGQGLCFIDPHGSAVQDLMAMMPPERVDDVIYFNAADTERPVGINILEHSTEEQKHIIVNSFIALLYKLYDPNKQGIMGPMLERTVRNVMLTAMSKPGYTMIEAMRLVIDPNFSKATIPFIKDPLVKRYWTDEMANTTAFHKSDKMGYFVSKFDRFVTERLMRNIIGQSTSSFNLREIMDNKKILLVDLSKGAIGEENSNFLGLLLVPRILASAMTRLDLPEEKRNDFYLYVDEFQNFATPDFATILSEARKYRLDLVVANQFIAQIKEDIRNAVFGNVGTLMSFRVGTDDAEYLEKQFDPVFKAHDLINNPVGQVYMKLLVNGAPTVPFSMSTDWPAIQALPKNSEMASRIKEMSRLKYGRDAALVEKEVNDRLNEGDVPTPTTVPKPIEPLPPLR